MIKDLLAELDRLNTQLKTRPISPGLLSNIEADWEVTHAYHSNALEGNTLTLAETKAVLLDDVVIPGHLLREHLEAVNHREAWRRMRRLCAMSSAVTDEDVLSLHRAILSGIQTADAGVYRRDRGRVVGSARLFPDPLEVLDLMPPMLEVVHADAAHPVLVAARAHWGLVAIHPFADGNRRTARLLMNMVLIRAGFPPALLLVTERTAYDVALERGNDGDLSSFEGLVATRVQVALLDLLDLTGEDSSQ